MTEPPNSSVYRKQCKSPEAFANELLIYRMNLPYVPRLLAVEEPLTILLERVDATTYLDFGDSWKVELMAQTIADFHLRNMQDGVTICHHDNQPRNILYDGEKFYLIDFEDICHNLPEHDVTHLMLFWAEEYSEEMFAARCNTFLNTYTKMITLNSQLWKTYLELNIKRFDDRRKEFNKLPSKDPIRTSNNRGYMADMLRIN